MSSGAKVVSHIIKEVTPGVTPTGTWDTLRLTGNALTPTVNTAVSDDHRFPHQPRLSGHQHRYRWRPDR